MLVSLWYILCTFVCLLHKLPLTRKWIYLWSLYHSFCFNKWRSCVGDYNSFKLPFQTEPASKLESHSMCQIKFKKKKKIIFPNQRNWLSSQITWAWLARILSTEALKSKYTQPLAFLLVIYLSLIMAENKYKKKKKHKNSLVLVY